MKKGDVVLIDMAQSDGKIKKRPALLLAQMPKYNDWLVCGISSQLHQFIKGFDEQIDSAHPDYKTSGLLKPSVVRLGFLAIIPSKEIKGAIGVLGRTTLIRLMNNLIRVLKGN